MSSDNAEERKRPEAFCSFCLKRTPHVYERIAVNCQMMSRAVCLACDNERPRDAG